MKKSILKLAGVQVLSKDEQKSINGGAGGCCNPNSPFGINFPDICNAFPRCVLE